MVARLHGSERRGGRVAARLDTDRASHSLDFEFAGLEPDDRLDAFVVAALPIAMRLGLALDVAGPVSSKLLETLPEAQRLLNGWHPELAPVEIRASAEPAPNGAGDRGVAAFFSGGADSFYTVMRHRDRLDALIHVHGFDVGFGEREDGERIRSHVREAAAAVGLPLVEVDTDLRRVSNRHAVWGTQYHGAALASIALLTAGRFREILIPATHKVGDPLPWGSHPDLDPLFGTEAVKIVHDGAIARPVKIAAVAESEVAMRYLRVCYRRGTGKLNCGRCLKCLWTMAALRSAGALERCGTLPNRLPLARLALQPLKGEQGRTRLAEQIAAAEGAGDRPLEAALRSMTVVGPHRWRFDRWRLATRKRLRRRSRPLRRRARQARRGIRRGSRPARRRWRKVRRRAARWR